MLYINEFDKAKIQKIIDEYTLPILHHELQPYLHDDSINHPLLNIDGGVHPRLYNRINRLYIYTKEKKQKNIKPNQWQSFLPNLSEQDRVMEFTIQEMKRKDFPGKNPDYYKILGQIWTDLEHIACSSSFLESMLGYFDDKKVSNEYAHYMMTPAERNIFSQLPNKFTVFRGHGDPLLNGISWTTNINIALQYAIGSSLKSSISVGKVQKSDIMAFIDRWNEDEIIVSSKLVNDIQTFEISSFKLKNSLVRDWKTPWNNQY